METWVFVVNDDQLVVVLLLNIMYPSHKRGVCYQTCGDIVYIWLLIDCIGGCEPTCFIADYNSPSKE